MNRPAQSVETPEERLERIRRVVSDFRRLRERGESVSIEPIIAEHQELMPELGEELRKLAVIVGQADEGFAQQGSEARQYVPEDTQTLPEDQSPAGQGGNPDFIGPLPNAAEEDDLPRQIGKYQVLCKLCTGGQFIVYRAWEPYLEQDVVIKLSRHAIDEASQRQELARQGQVVAQRDHLNLDRVLELGFHESRPFLAMKFIQGTSLAQHGRDTRLTPRDAAVLVAKIARALAAVHRAGVIHRDITPRNVLVDQQGEPWVIDFGLALVRDAWRPEPASTDRPTGTPSYMPPEQARGEEVDPRSDVFGLGAVLYFLLTGKAPFEPKDKTNKRETMLEAIERAANCDFERKALKRRGIRPGLRKICLRAMAARRQERYQTAEAMAKALERWLARRRKMLLGAAVLAVALVAIGIWAIGFLPYRGSGGEAAAEIKLTAWRNDQPLALHQAVPLRTNEELRIECHVRQGLFAGLFWLDAAGQLHELPLEVIAEPTPDEPFSTLVWPGRDRSNVLAPPAGTEIVFVCASDQGPPNKEEVAADLAGYEPWPELPSRVLVEFDHEGVRWSGAATLRGPGRKYRQRPIDEVLERAEALRRMLKERFPVVCGVAFPHIEPPGPPP